MASRAASRYGVIRAGPPEFAGLGARRRDAPREVIPAPNQERWRLVFLAFLAVNFIFFNATLYQSHSLLPIALTFQH